jgi:hypothetical protein
LGVGGSEACPSASWEKASAHVHRNVWCQWDPTGLRGLAYQAGFLLTVGPIPAAFVRKEEALSLWYMPRPTEGASGVFKTQCRDIPQPSLYPSSVLRNWSCPSSCFVANKVWSAAPPLFTCQISVQKLAPCLLPPFFQTKPHILGSSWTALDQKFFFKKPGSFEQGMLFSDHK